MNNPPGKQQQILNLLFPGPKGFILYRESMPKYKIDESRAWDLNRKGQLPWENGHPQFSCYAAPTVPSIKHFAEETAKHLDVEIGWAHNPGRIFRLFVMPVDWNKFKADPQLGRLKLMYAQDFICFWIWMCGRIEGGGVKMIDAYSWYIDYNSPQLTEWRIRTEPKTPEMDGGSKGRKRKADERDQ